MTQVQTQQAVVIDNKFKEEVEKFMVDKILNALELNQIDFGLMKQISNDILNEIDLVQDYPTFIKFLETMKTKYPILAEVYNLYKNKFYEEKEKAVVGKLSEYIKSLKTN